MVVVLNPVVVVVGMLLPDPAVVVVVLEIVVGFDVDVVECADVAVDVAIVVNLGSLLA